MKFHECFIVTLGTFISVDHLYKIYINNRQLYHTGYYGHFYCPECHTAKLSFIPNAKTPHFKTMPHEIHQQDCSFNFKPANKQQLETYHDQGENHDAILRKLQALLDILVLCNQESNKRNKPVSSRYCRQ